jgi:hypothetical protein
MAQIYDEVIANNPNRLQYKLGDFLSTVTYQFKSTFGLFLKIEVQQGA